MLKTFEICRRQLCSMPFDIKKGLEPTLPYLGISLLFIQFKSQDEKLQPKFIKIIHIEAFIGSQTAQEPFVVFTAFL